VRGAEKLKAVEIAPEFIVRAAVFNGSAELPVRVPQQSVDDALARGAALPLLLFGVGGRKFS